MTAANPLSQSVTSRDMRRNCLRSTLCVTGDLLEYPLLVLAFDIDPFFIVLNEVTVAMRAKADLIGAGIVMEPSQVERLEKCFTSS